MNLLPSPTLTFDQAFSTNIPTSTGGIKTGTIVLIGIGCAIIGIYVGYQFSKHYINAVAQDKKSGSPWVS